jgi:hypothetical protein
MDDDGPETVEATRLLSKDKFEFSLDLTHKRNRNTGIARSYFYNSYIYIKRENP